MVFLLNTYNLSFFNVRKIEMNPNFSYSSSEISLNEYALFSLLSSIAVFFFPFSNLFTSVTVFCVILSAWHSSILCVLCFLWCLSSFVLLLLVQDDSISFSCVFPECSQLPFHHPLLSSPIFLDSSPCFVVFILGFALLIILSCWNISIIFTCRGASLVVHLVQNPPAMWETWV